MDLLVFQEAEDRQDLEYNCEYMIWSYVRNTRALLQTRLLAALHHSQFHTVFFEETTQREAILREEIVDTFAFNLDMLRAVSVMCRERVYMAERVKVILTLEERYQGYHSSTFTLALTTVVLFEEVYARSVLMKAESCEFEANLWLYDAMRQLSEDEAFYRYDILTDEEEAYSHVAMLEDTVGYVAMQCAQSSDFLEKFLFVGEEHRARDSIVKEEIVTFCTDTFVPNFVSMCMVRASIAQERAAEEAKTSLVKRFVSASAKEIRIFRQESLGRQAIEYEESILWPILYKEAFQIHNLLTALQLEEMRCRGAIEEDEANATNSERSELGQWMYLTEKLGDVMALDIQEWSNRQMIQSYKLREAALFRAVEKVQGEEAIARHVLLWDIYWPSLHKIQRMELEQRWWNSRGIALKQIHDLVRAEEFARGRNICLWWTTFNRLKQELLFYIAALSTSPILRDFYLGAARIALEGHSEDLSRLQVYAAEETAFKVLRIGFEETMRNTVLGLAIMRLESMEAKTARPQVMLFERCLFERIGIMEEEGRYWFGASQSPQSTAAPPQIDAGVKAFFLTVAKRSSRPNSAYSRVVAESANRVSQTTTAIQSVVDVDWRPWLFVLSHVQEEEKTSPMPEGNEREMEEDPFHRLMSVEEQSRRERSREVLYGESLLACFGLAAVTYKEHANIKMKEVRASARVTVFTLAVCEMLAKLQLGLRKRYWRKLEHNRRYADRRRVLQHRERLRKAHAATKPDRGARFSMVVDPKSNLPLAEYTWLPESLQPLFKDILERDDGSALIFYLSVVVRVNPSGTVSSRVLLVTRSAMYLCTPEAEIDVYILLDTVAKLDVCQNLMGIQIPAQYDVLLRFDSAETVRNLTHTLETLMSHLVMPRRNPTVLHQTGESFTSHLRLDRPPGLLEPTPGPLDIVDWQQLSLLLGISTLPPIFTLNK